jgi:acyl dehydratase
VSFNRLYWEDVKEGDIVPSVSLELTRDRIVMIVCGTRDIFPLHHDNDFALASGYKAPAAPIAFIQGFIGRCLTDWTGPTGKIRKISLVLNSPNYQGDMISVTGKVTRKCVDNDNHNVDCELVVIKQDNTVSVRAKATVTLPVRSKSRSRLVRHDGRARNSERKEGTA